MREMQVSSLSQDDPLEEEMAAHCSILAWTVPWTEEPDWLQSTEAQRVRHSWARTHDKVLSFVLYIGTCLAEPLLNIVSFGAGHTQG